jgi:hypothetical protein
MKDVDNNDKFVPLFPFSEPNHSAIIAKDEALIKDSNGIVLLHGNVEVRLDLIPRPRIHVKIYPIEELNDIKRWELVSIFGSRDLLLLELKNHGKDIKGFVTKFKLSNTKDPFIIFSPSSEPIIGIEDNDTHMQKIVFHLFNFKEICANNGIYSENVHLESNNLIVELKSLTESENNFKKLEEEGGYGLTHMGCLKKRDNTFISSEEAIEILRALQYFFSFANGAWCNPVCAVGFDLLGNKVWELWSSPIESIYSRKVSWFDEHHSEQLENLFPGFMNHWFNADWKDTLQKVIYWYIISNTSRIDAGIILTQSALERLSSEHFKANPIKGTAANKLKELFCDLNIPVDLTENTPKLKKLAEDVNKLIDANKWKKEYKWTNGPIAFTGIRNYLVHSKHIYDPLEFGPAIYDSWNLGQWYLELSLLKECDYLETYCNRLNPGWVGDVEKTPWKK